MARTSDSPQDTKQRQIEAAQQIREYLGSIDQLQNADHRAAATYDQIVGGIHEICDKHHQEHSGCFTPPQIACLKEIGFQVAYIADPRDRVPPTGLTKIRHDFKQASWLVKIPVIVGLLAFGIGTIRTVIADGYQLITWFKSDSKPAPGAQHWPPWTPP